MATGTELVYVDRPTCKLPALAPSNPQITEAGQPWTCPDCGRVWTTIIQYGTGAQCNTVWQSTAAPGQLSPLGQRVAALEQAGTAEAAASSQAAYRLSALESTTTGQSAALTQLFARMTAAEARAVVVNYARVPVTALLVNGKLDVPVTWDQAFADTTYTIRYPAPSALLTKATVAVKSKTTTGAVFTVTATAAVVASELEVIAYRYG